MTYLIGAANNLFTTLGYVGPSLLSHLFQSHCLALYGSELWRLNLLESLRRLLTTACDVSDPYLLTLILLFCTIVLIY